MYRELEKQENNYGGVRTVVTSGDGEQNGTIISEGHAGGLQELAMSLFLPWLVVTQMLALKLFIKL